jgi:hypothetical protein
VLRHLSTDPNEGSIALEPPADPPPGDLILGLDEWSSKDPSRPVSLTLDVGRREASGGTARDSIRWDPWTSVALHARIDSWCRVPLHVPPRPLRLSLAGGPARVRVVRAVYLDREPPAGRVLSPCAESSVTAMDAERVTLKNDAGAEVTLPRECIRLSPPFELFSLMSPGRSEVVHFCRDQSVHIRMSPSSWSSQSLSMLGAGFDGPEWIGGIAAWTILRRASPPRVLQYVYDPGLGVGFAARDDGPLLVVGLTRTHAAFSDCLYYHDAGHLRHLVTLEPDQTLLHYSTGDRGYHGTTSLWGLLATRGASFAPGRTLDQLRQFVSSRALPAIESVVGRAPPLAVGDRIQLRIPVDGPEADFSIGRSPQTPGVSRLRMAMVKDDRAYLSLETSSGARELALPRSFLPEIPAPEPGQVLALRRIASGPRRFGPRRPDEPPVREPVAGRMGVDLSRLMDRMRMGDREKVRELMRSASWRPSASPGQTVPALPTPVATAAPTRNRQADRSER